MLSPHAAGWPALLAFLRGRDFWNPPALIRSLSLGCRMEKYGLPDFQSTDAHDRAVDSRVVLVRANHRFQHSWCRTGCVGIEVHHRAADVAHGDGDGGGAVVFILFPE